MSKFEGLDELGLTEYEKDAYLSLIRYGSMIGPEVSEKTDIPKTRVYDVLRSLKDQGLTSQIQQSPMKFAPNNPQETIDAEFTKRINQLEYLREETISEVSNIDSENKEEPSQDIDVYRGEGEMFRQISQRVQNCKEELKILGVGRSPPKNTEIEIRRLIERGVKVKFILTSDLDNTEMDLKEFNKAGINVKRRKAEPNFAIMLLDDKELMISVLDQESKEDRISIFFKNNSLAELMSDYYDKLWNESSEI